MSVRSAYYYPPQPPFVRSYCIRPCPPPPQPDPPVVPRSLPLGEQHHRLVDTGMLCAAAGGTGIVCRWMIHQRTIICTVLHWERESSHINNNNGWSMILVMCLHGWRSRRSVTLVQRRRDYAKFRIRTRVVHVVRTHSRKCNGRR